ncbi:MAG: ABC transporter substrate-binding protein [Bacteroidota bacterium]|nr:ABC transporter substrate-binding protein [Bacteroidota bacterium]
MIRKYLYLVLVLFAGVLVSCKNQTNNNKETAEKSQERIVSLSGGITEVLCALGYEEQIIGVDVTSTYPKQIKEKATDLGHVRSVSLEQIIGLKPTIVLASDKDLNNEVVDKLKQAQIRVEIVSQEQSVEGTKKFIEDIAKIFSSDKHQDLIANIDAHIQKIQSIEPKPKVLFIYARGAGTLMVAGTNTPMERIIEIAGGENAIKDFADFKPLTSEALIDNNPDVILMFDKGLESLGGIDGLLQIQGVEQTKAGKNRRIIAMDGGFLTSFGVRLGEAAVELNTKLKK